MSLEMQPTTPGGAAAWEEWGPRAPPDLLADESEDEYEAMLARMRGLVRPADLIEEFWVRDVVDLIWEAQRLRRLKAQMMKGAAQHALVRALKPVILSDVLPGQDSRHLPSEVELAARFAAGEAEAVERTQKLLGRHGQTARAITMRAVADRMDDIDRFNRMIAAADRQRMCILREIERHRATFGRELRQAAERIGGGGAEAPAPATDVTAAPAGRTSPDIRASPEAGPARLCKPTNQTQALKRRLDPAAPPRPATSLILQTDKTNPFGPDLEAEPAPPCRSSNQSQPLEGRPEQEALPRAGASPDLQNEKTKPIDPAGAPGRQPRPAAPFRPAPRVEENPARIPTDGPTEPPAPPPDSPEWDEYYRRSMGRPVGRHTEWWPKGPARTDREIEEERLRSAGYSDIESRIHRALNRKPLWIRGPPRQS